MSKDCRSRMTRRNVWRSPIRERRYRYAALGAVLVLAGCSLLRSQPQLDEPIGLIAVLPIERDEPAPAPAGGEAPHVAPAAERLPAAAPGIPLDRDESTGKPIAGDRRGIAPGAERIV